MNKNQDMLTAEHLFLDSFVHEVVCVHELACQVHEIPLSKGLHLISFFELICISV